MLKTEDLRVKRTAESRIQTHAHCELRLHHWDHHASLWCLKSPSTRIKKHFGVALGLGDHSKAAPYRTQFLLLLHHLMEG